MNALRTPLVKVLSALLVLTLIVSCGGSDAPKRSGASKADGQSAGGGSSGGGGDAALTRAEDNTDYSPGGERPGAESDTGPKEYGEFGVILRATPLMPRKTDYENYARAVLGPDPTEEQRNTFDKRVAEGRIRMLPAGTRVERASKNTRGYRLRSGETFQFWRVQLEDMNIEPNRGRVLDKDIKWD